MSWSRTTGAVSARPASAAACRRSSAASFHTTQRRWLAVQAAVAQRALAPASTRSAANSAAPSACPALPTPCRARARHLTSTFHIQRILVACHPAQGGERPGRRRRSAHGPASRRPQPSAAPRPRLRPAPALLHPRVKVWLDLARPALTPYSALTNLWESGSPHQRCEPDEPTGVMLIGSSTSVAGTANERAASESSAATAGDSRPCATADSTSVSGLQADQAHAGSSASSAPSSVHPQACSGGQGPGLGTGFVAGVDPLACCRRLGVPALGVPAAASAWTQAAHTASLACHMAAHGFSCVSPEAHPAGKSVLA